MGPRVPATTWKLLTQTVGVCLRYRVTGLAAEGAFFAILSLPPLIFGLAGSIGYIASRYFDVETIDEIKLQIVELAAPGADRGLGPERDRADAGPGPERRPAATSSRSVSCSRCGPAAAALNVFVDTITIMYGMGGKRGIVRTRALSFSLYCVGTRDRRDRAAAGAGRPGRGRRRSCRTGWTS